MCIWHLCGRAIYVCGICLVGGQSVHLPTPVHEGQGDPDSHLIGILSLNVWQVRSSHFNLYQSVVIRSGIGLHVPTAISASLRPHFLFPVLCSNSHKEFNIKPTICTWITA